MYKIILFDIKSRVMRCYDLFHFNMIIMLMQNNRIIDCFPKKLFK